MKGPLALLLVCFALGGCGARRSAGEAPARDAPRCGASGLAIQVLGSGGPIAEGGRASAGYAVWIDGRARLLVDAGGGTFQRMGALSLDLREPRALLLTHLHVDHTSDLPALLKSASFTDRAEPLALIGPSGDGEFPPLSTFLEALMGARGAWRYLDAYLERGEPFPLKVRDVDVGSEEPAVVVDEPDLKVRAVGVPHGPVPALGYLVEARGRRVAFTGDQRMDEDRFVELVRGVDLLIAHHAIPESATPSMAKLHARPSQIGALAARAEVGQLVLSHHMKRSLDHADEGLRQIRQRYAGPVVMANDLDCF
jgi:ribonuclease BN (tRNA processing enzyme)